MEISLKINIRKFNHDVIHIKIFLKRIKAHLIIKYSFNQ